MPINITKGIEIIEIIEIIIEKRKTSKLEELMENLYILEILLTKKKDRIGNKKRANWIAFISYSPMLIIVRLGSESINVLSMLSGLFTAKIISIDESSMLNNVFL